MVEVWLARAVHEAKVRQQFFDRWKDVVPPDRTEAVVDSLVYEGLWLRKFPTLTQPKFDVGLLDAVDKGRKTGTAPDGATLVPLGRTMAADVVRFVKDLNAETLDRRYELFFAGRPWNKPVVWYLNAWFDRAAVLRAALGPSPSMLETVFD